MSTVNTLNEANEATGAKAFAVASIYKCKLYIFLIFIFWWSNIGAKAPHIYNSAKNNTTLPN